MSDKELKIWHAKRLIILASKAAVHASKRIRSGMPARVALHRTDCLIKLSHQAWQEATA
jgi:hypothetical protein